MSSEQIPPLRLGIGTERAGANDPRRINTVEDLKPGDIFEAIHTNNGTTITSVTLCRCIALGTRQDYMDPNKLVPDSRSLVAEQQNSADEWRIATRALGDIGLSGYFGSDAEDDWNAFNYCRRVNDNTASKHCI